MRISLSSVSNDCLRVLLDLQFWEKRGDFAWRDLGVLELQRLRIFADFFMLGFLADLLALIL